MKKSHFSGGNFSDNFAVGGFERLCRRKESTGLHHYQLLSYAEM